MRIPYACNTKLLTSHQTCSFCHLSLVSQWQRYSSTSEGQNPSLPCLLSLMFYIQSMSKPYCVSTFKIYPGSYYFSLPPLFAPWSKSPSYLVWTTIIASCVALCFTSEGTYKGFIRLHSSSARAPSTHRGWPHTWHMIYHLSNFIVLTLLVHSAPAMLFLQSAGLAPTSGPLNMPFSLFQVFSSLNSAWLILHIFWLFPQI